MLSVSASALIREGYAIVDLDDALSRGVDQVFVAANGFFSQSADRKNLARSVCPSLGYHDRGSEYAAGAGRPDQIETFATSLDHDVLGGEDAACRGAAEAEHLAGSLRAIAAAYRPLVDDLLLELASHFSGKPVTTPIGTSRASIAQVNVYDMRSHDSGVVRDAQEDGTLLTFVIVDQPGVEILRPCGSWSAPKLTTGSVLVMPGEIMAVMTGGAIPPLYHRVRRHVGVGALRSLIYIVDTDEGQNLVPWQRSPSNSGVNIVSKVKANYARFEGGRTLIPR